MFKKITLFLLLGLGLGFGCEEAADDAAALNPAPVNTIEPAALTTSWIQTSLSTSKIQVFAPAKASNGRGFLFLAGGFVRELQFENGEHGEEGCGVEGNQSTSQIPTPGEILREGKWVLEQQGTDWLLALEFGGLSTKYRVKELHASRLRLELLSGL